MNFVISPDLIDQYPSFRVMIVTAENIQFSTDNKEIDSMLEAEQDNVKANFEISDLPKYIIRQTYVGRSN